MSESTFSKKSKKCIKNDGHQYLVEKARKLRRKTFNAFVAHGEAHLGGSFSIIEMLLTLYEKVLKVRTSLF